MNKRPELDVKNPPGQIVNRPKWSDDQQLYYDTGGLFGTADPPSQSSGGVRYLRDVIKKYQEEERQEPLVAFAATLPSVDWKKRYNGLVGALMGLLDDYKIDHPVEWQERIKEVIEKA